MQHLPSLFGFEEGANCNVFTWMPAFSASVKESHGTNTALPAINSLKMCLLHNSGLSLYDLDCRKLLPPFGLKSGVVNDLWPSCFKSRSRTARSIEPSALLKPLALWASSDAFKPLN